MQRFFPLNSNRNPYDTRALEHNGFVWALNQLANGQNYMNKLTSMITI